MVVKFVSKNSNYMVVLRSGMEGNRALGTHTVPGLYVRFQDGVADIKEESVIKMLREHPSFGVDFLEVKPDEVDPYKDTREDIEPPHVTAELKYGHVESPKTTGKVKITPQMKKVLEKEALKMLPGLIKSNPGLLKGLIVELAAEMKAKEDANNKDKQPEAQKPEEEEVA